MKEYAQENSNNDKLPVIRQGSQQRLQSQTKLDRLLSEISNKNITGQHTRTHLATREQENNEKNHRVLLKNVSTLSKINLRVKGETTEATKISKKVELESINDTLLTKKQSKQPLIQNQTKAPTVRISIHINEHNSAPSIDENQLQIAPDEVFMSSLQNFLTSNLAVGVFCKDLSGDQAQQ